MHRQLRSFSKISSTSRPSMPRILAWSFIQNTVFKSSFTLSVHRVFFLKLFGCEVGRNVLIKRGVRIHFPWNLTIGDDCWIGEEVWFINHAKITLGSNVCISQRSIICSSGHDFRSASLEYAHKPVVIRDGAWVCLDSKILPGVTIGECSVVSAGEVVRNSLPDFSILVDRRIRQIDAPR